MASSTEILQSAVQAARAGRRAEARDLLIELVEIDPRNEMAWIWLSGLVDSLEDQIIACENVLTINPANAKIRTYLAQLQKQSLSSREINHQTQDEAVDLFLQAKAAAERNEIDNALRLARQAV